MRKRVTERIYILRTSTSKNFRAVSSARNRNGAAVAISGGHNC